MSLDEQLYAALNRPGQFPSPIGRNYHGASPYGTLPGSRLPAPNFQARTVIIPGDPPGEGYGVATGPSCDAAPVPPITIGENADNCFDLPYAISARVMLDRGATTAPQMLAKITDLVADLRLPQEAREREHRFLTDCCAPAKAFLLEENTAADFAIPAAGVSLVAISFQMPATRVGVLNKWGRAFRFTNDPAAAAPPVWSLRINGRPVVPGIADTDQLYASVFDVSPGFMRIPSQFLEPVRFYLQPNDLVELVVIADGAEPGGRGAAARLTGWTFPADWVAGARYFTPCDR